MVRRATLEDIHFVIDNIRSEDEQEILRLGSNPEEALLESFQLSSEAYACEVRGEVIGVFGLAPGPVLSGSATIWAIGTGEIPKNPKLAYKLVRDFSNHAIKKYSRVENFVDAKYIKCINWLKRVGFKEGSTYHSAEGNPFTHMYKEA